MDDLSLEKMRGLLILAASLPDVSYVKRYLTSIALMLLTGGECVQLVDQTTSSYFLLRELLGVDLVNCSGLAENLASSTSEGIRFTLSMDNFTAHCPHEPVERSKQQHQLVQPVSSAALSEQTTRGKSRADS